MRWAARRVPQGLELHGRAHAEDLDLHVGVARAKGAHRLGQETEPAQARDGDAEPSELALAHAAALGRGPVGGGEDFARAPDEGLACGGELDAPLGAVEELRPDLLLEVLDGPGHGRLDDVQAARGAAVVELFRERDERLEVAQVHGQDVILPGLACNEITEPPSDRGGSS